MMTFITYSNNQPFEKYGESIINQADKYFDETYHYKLTDIQDFKKQNISLWRDSKGDGYWSWKPYIIHKHLLKNKNIKNNIIVYCDTRFNIVDNISDLIKQYFLEDDNYLFATKNHHFSVHSRHKEVMWSKGDAFKATTIDMNNMLYEEQIWAGFLCFRNNEKSLKIVKEWLSLSQNEQIISDAESIEKNHPTFKEHRHDQSILSLVLKKNLVEVKEDRLSHELSSGRYIKYFYP